MSLPVTLHLEGRLAVIVGGGSVAVRKAATLKASGARVRVVAPELDDRLRSDGTADDLVPAAYAPEHLDGAALAIAATDRVEVNARVLADARARGILASDAADPKNGDFTMPAVTRMGRVQVAIETDGASPVLSKRLGQEIADIFGGRVDAAAETLHRMRTYVQTVLPQEQRSAVLRELGSRGIDELARMNPVEAEHEVEATIARLQGHRPLETHSAICATRASQLAMTQTRTVAARLALEGVATTLLTVTTTGDRVQDRALTAIGSESLFVKELELALRERRADYAVHSCKDLPTTLPDDMRIAAISSREDPRDAFCSEKHASFAALPAGAVVGTSSLRRRAQLAALRSDLEYRDIRGNVDTRLRKLREGQYDAIVLASAGLRRLNVSATHTVPFEPDELTPAAAQGALAVEVRAGEEHLANKLRAAINDPQTELVVLCERAALRSLQGGCQAPIGIHARFESEELAVSGVIASLDGATVIRANERARVATPEEAEALGVRLADALRERGAGAVLAQSPRPQALALSGRLAIVPRTQDRPSRIAAHLRDDGAEVIELRDGDAFETQRVPDLLVFASSGSVQAALPLLHALRERGARPVVAAMGPASASAAREAGFAPDVVAPEASIDALAGAIRAHALSMETVR